MKFCFSPRIYIRFAPGIACPRVVFMRLSVVNGFVFLSAFLSRLSCSSIESQYSRMTPLYGVGCVWLLAAHVLPFGCSSWLLYASCSIGHIVQYDHYHMVESTTAISICYCLLPFVFLVVEIGRKRSLSYSEYMMVLPLFAVALWSLDALRGWHVRHKNKSALYHFLMRYFKGRYTFCCFAFFIGRS